MCDFGGMWMSILDDDIKHEYEHEYESEHESNHEYEQEHEPILEDSPEHFADIELATISGYRLVKSSSTQTETTTMDTGSQTDSETLVLMDTGFYRVIGKLSCTCPKNKCCKRYCPCFAAGAGCGESCHCVNCDNPIKILNV